MVDCIIVGYCSDLTNVTNKASDTEGFSNDYDEKRTYFYFWFIIVNLFVLNKENHRAKCSYFYISKSL